MSDGVESIYVPLLTNDERRLQRALHVLTVLFFIAALVYLFGALLGPFRSFLRELPFAAGSVVKATALMLLCLYGAGDVRGRPGLADLVVVAHLLSVTVTLIFLALGEAGTVVTLGSWQPTVGTVLWGGVVLDGVIAGVLLWFTGRARKAVRIVRGHQIKNPQSPEARGSQPTVPDAVLKIILIVLGAAFAADAILVAAGPLRGGAFFVELPLVANTVVLAGVLALVCFYIVADQGKRLPLVSVLITSQLAAVGTLLLFVLFADPSGTAPLGADGIPVRTLLWLALTAHAGVAALLWVLKTATFRSRFSPTYLSPTQYRTLIALADVLVLGPNETVRPIDVAKLADKTLGSIRAVRRWAQRLVLLLIQLHPLLYLKAPFSELDADSRLRHLKVHFQKDVTLRLIPNGWRNFVQAMMRIAKQLTYVGYYGNPETFASIGYTPFEAPPGREGQLGMERPRVVALRGAGAIPDRNRPDQLDVITPERVDRQTVETDVCVIGSGAAGAVIAYHLAALGKHVIVLERGDYVRPQDFSSDELTMMGKLYADGLFQQTRDYQFTVLQGSCVGGTTVVNNAVCFPPPDRVLTQWGDVYQAGLDNDDVMASDLAIRKWLPILPQDEGALDREAVEYIRTRWPEFQPPADGRLNPHMRLNPSFPKFLDGAMTAGLRQIGRVSRPTGQDTLKRYPVDANIKDCLGCGYCNIGCAYGKKLSMLDTALPWAQDQFGADRVQIYSGCEVTKIDTGEAAGQQEARAVHAKLPDGRRLTVRAGKVVVSAGAIASSYLLLRSGIGRTLPVGKYVSFNMGAPLTAEFPESGNGPMNAYDGLQISHYGQPPDQRGWVYETWWNPPVAQAINMPGWFERHYANMHKYPHLMAVGMLVGTERNASVRRALTGGPDLVYVPTPNDLRKLADGLIQLGQILFAAGAKRILLNAWNYYEFTSPNGLYEILRIARDPTDLTLGTGHPQGGNAISKDPALGVVGPDFRVHGYRNLYVCDASVFPSSLTVNPQETVMALAHYAVPRIAADAP